MTSSLRRHEAMSLSGNWSTTSGQSGLMILVPQSNSDLHPSLPTTPSTAGKDDSGAGYYVIVVILVYGMSIVALIASHIKRKHSKLLEDRQIHKYLKEFQVSINLVSMFVQCNVI